MSNIVVDSQIRNGEKYIERGYQEDLLSAPEVISSSYPVAQDLRYINPITTTEYGSTVEFNVPVSIFLYELWLQFTINAPTSGTYCDYPGLSIIQSVQFSSGSNILAEFDYDVVMANILSIEESPKTVSAILECSGGTGAGAGSYIAPIPLFFSQLVKPDNMYVHPLQAFLSSSSLRLRLTLRPLSQVLASGASHASPTISSRLYYIQGDCPADIRTNFINNINSYQYYSYDWQTVPQSASVSSGTSFSYNISSLYGAVASLSLFDRSVTDIDTNHKYYNTLGSISSLQCLIEGVQYYNNDGSANSIKYQKVIASDHPGITQSIGDPAVVPFSVANNMDGRHAGGFLSMDNINTLSLVATQSSGSNVYYKLCAKVLACYKVSSGNFVRIS